jgi:hypothetical protein
VRLSSVLEVAEDEQEEGERERERRRLEREVEAMVQINSRLRQDIKPTYSLFLKKEIHRNRY